MKIATWNVNSLRARADRVEAFLGSDVGGGIAAVCVLLQAAGIVWMARLTRIEV